LPQAPLHFEELERFGVAAALEEMAELGIDLRRQGLFEALDLFGNVANVRCGNLDRRDFARRR
jgi:hypothetical protein